MEELFLERLGILTLGVLCGGANTGIVDKNVQLGFLGGYLLDQLLDRLLRGDVCGGRDDFSGNVFRVRFYHSVKLLFHAANYVNLGTVDCEGLSGHQAAIKPMPDPPPVTRATVQPLARYVGYFNFGASHGVARTSTLHAEDMLKLEVFVVVLGRHFGTCQT